MPVLEVKNLTKIYDETPAVGGISFAVKKGEIVGLLGPNGAGKTTTINMILGVLQPTSGTIHIEGIDISKDANAALMHTNFCAVYAQLPGNLTIRQNLYIFALLYCVQNPRARVEEVIQEFDLERFADSKSGLLSSGEQTRLALAKAMLNRPKLLLLDEPTASLDPSVARTTREDIQRYAHTSDVGILWTSHNMYEVETVCDRVLFLSKGKVLLEGNPRELPRQHGEKNLEDLFVKVAREPLSIAVE